MSLEHIPRHVWWAISFLIGASAIFIVGMTCMVLRSEHLEVKAGYLAVTAQAEKLQIVTSEVQQQVKKVDKCQAINSNKNPTNINQRLPDDSSNIYPHQDSGPQESNATLKLKEINNQLGLIKRKFDIRN